MKYLKYEHLTKINLITILRLCLTKYAFTIAIMQDNFIYTDRINFQR